ncbi:MAG: hypothetical protein J0H98_11690, partial [Solirubrobacterales bacterium]|nr:hypothetical protein [Solirubrobacterales bacterium]
LTFGLLWYVGALGPARDGSWWARRSDREQAEVGYRAERRARRQRIVLRTSVALGVVFLIGFLATYPTLLTGTDRTSLQYSVGGPISFVHKCDRDRGGDWTCYRYDDAVSGDVPFRTTVDRLGCWTATNDAKGYSSIDRELSGCVTVFSHLRLAGRILGW